MVKKISVLALAGLLALPAMASAGAGGAAATTSDMQAQMDALTKQLNALKAQMAQIKTAQDEKFEDFDAKSEKWDLASRFQWSGDFRARMDYASADTPAHFTALNVGRGVEWFTDPDVLRHPFVDGTGDAVSGRYTIAQNVHTIDVGGASAGAANGTANMLYGFFFTDPTSPTTGNAVASATAAGQTIGTILYGNPAAVTINPATGSVTIAAGATQQTQSAKTQALVGVMKTFTPAQRASLFAGMGYVPTPSTDYDNDTIWTNRLRLDLRAKALENVEFKGRLAMYKAWGMQNNPADYSYNNGMGGGPFALAGYMSDFDGATTRNPNDSILRVDRAFVNWNAIGGSPVWFSIGRRPTTDGPPANLKLGSDERMATPGAVMDYAFDGISVGYAYNNLFGLADAPGRVRVCYGRGFESGPDSDQNKTLNDTDFAGVSWDVFKKGNRFLYLQSFGAFNIFNVPDNVDFANPIEFAVWEDDSSAFNPLNSATDMKLGRANLGNVYHTSGVYSDKFQNLNYFLGAAWSRTDAQGMDEMGTSLLGEWWNEPADHSGYNVHVGVRYDINDRGLKVGAEYNHGSKYWIAMTPGHDDMYVSKLATRGDVYEVYGIYDIPGGEAISKFGKAWMRLGVQHYEYNYTGSGFWLGEPHKIEDLQSDPMMAQFYTPIDKMDQVYLTFEASF